MAQQYPLPLPYQTTFGADDFMPAACNRAALDWIELWPNWSHPCLIITGTEGSGKTHLAHVWRARSMAAVLNPQSLLDAGIDTRSLIPPSHNVMFDNADDVAGHSAQEETLFHLFNIVRDMKGFMLLTSRQAPSQWGLQLADLRSRLLASPTVAIAPPDDTLLAALLVKQFHDRQITLSDDVVNYILPRIERSAAAVGRLVEKLDQNSLAEKRGITIALARRVMEAAE